MKLTFMSVGCVCPMEHHLAYLTFQWPVTQYTRYLRRIFDVLVVTRVFPCYTDVTPQRVRGNSSTFQSTTLYQLVWRPHLHPKHRHDAQMKLSNSVRRTLTFSSHSMKTLLIHASAIISKLHKI